MKVDLDASSDSGDEHLHKLKQTKIDKLLKKKITFPLKGKAIRGKTMPSMLCYPPPASNDDELIIIDLSKNFEILLTYICTQINLGSIKSSFVSSLDSLFIFF